MPNLRHSRAYHRYFEGYAEKQVSGENGRTATQRVYVGSYYRVARSDAGLRRQRGLFLLLYLLAAALFLWAGSTARVSAVWGVAVVTMAALLGLILLAIPVFHRLTVPREMEVRAWRESSGHLRNVSLGAAVCLLFCAASTLAAAFLLMGGLPAGELLAAALYAASGGLTVAIHQLEKGTEYEVLPPKNQRPDGSSPIRYYAPD